MSIKKIILCCVLFFLGIQVSYATSSIGSRVSIGSSSSLNLTVPSSDLKLAATYRNNMHYRMEVLPEVDKYLPEYLVIPSNGLVIPIVETQKNSYDQELLINGNEIDYNKYLKGGAMKFSTETHYGEFGNIVVFGHSSYWKSDNGRYKTHFQKIIELDDQEEVWVFEQLSDGTYKRNIYSVSKHYNTPASNLEVLKNKRYDKKLTLFTCTPIGGLSGRRIVESHYNESTPRRNLGEKNSELIKKAVANIGKHPKKKLIIPKIIGKIIEVRDQVLLLPTGADQESKLNILFVIEEELQQLY